LALQVAPDITFKYDETMDPREFLQVYTTAMEITEGGESSCDGKLVPTGAEGAG
jgi:hypothetical protein